MGRTIYIAPSILSADFANLADEIGRVERAGADLLHVDVMDGQFVPNITLGPPVVAAIRKVTRLTLDVHLMIEEPSRYVAEFLEAGANWISFHAEADRHLHRTVHYIQEKGGRAGIALNPATPIGILEEVLPDLDYVLIMSVNPGFGGQKFIPGALDKIRRLREMITSGGHRARIEVDGGVSSSNLRSLLNSGADVLVAGSAVFSAASGAEQSVMELRSIAEEYSRIYEVT